MKQREVQIHKVRNKTRHRRMILVIVLAQLMGLVGVFALKMEMDQFSVKYKNMGTNSYRKLYLLDEIRAKVYLHESYVTNFIMEEDPDNWEECEEETTKLNEEIEQDMEALKEILKKQGGENQMLKHKTLLYRIRTYLNSTDTIFELCQGTSYQVGRYFMLTRTKMYVDTASEKMIDLQEDAKSELAYTSERMKEVIANFRLYFRVIVGLIIVTAVGCYLYCRRILNLNDRYMKNAERANQAKSTFLSNVSHEIRTPINAVLGMNEMIQRECEDAQIIEYSKNIQMAGKTLLGLINDVLDFSKIEAGKIELIDQEYRLDYMVRDLSNMIKPRAKEKELDFEVEFDEQAPSELRGDDLRLRQIIINMLTNAVKYTPSGKVWLKIGYEKIDENRVCLLIAVKDTGIGLRPEEMEKLTKPFERLDEKKNHGIEGTGLGMNITSNLLKLMDSELRVDSVYGEGSTFSFKVEQVVCDWKPVAACKADLSTKEKKVNDGPLFEAAERCILAVDDVDMNLKVIKALLRRTKLQIDLASSGAKCLEMIKEKQYDLILMDHMMPEMDGVETLEQIRASETVNQKTPIVALTANAVAGQATFYEEKGFDGYLTKPVQGPVLEEMIWSFLQKNDED